MSSSLLVLMVCLLFATTVAIIIIAAVEQPQRNMLAPDLPTRILYPHQGSYRSSLFFPSPCQLFAGVGHSSVTQHMAVEGVSFPRKNRY